jgi:hypothetical protein
MNLHNLPLAIEKQRAAWRAYHEAAGQLSTFNSEAAKVRAKIADLRADSTTDAAKVGKALTEQSGILDITETRIERAKSDLQAAKEAAQHLSSTQTVNALNDARDALGHYWHNLRCLVLIPQLREWMSPTAFTQKANWIKSTVSEIADEDPKVCEVYELHYKASDHSGVTESNFEAVAQFLLSHQDELPAAFEFVSNRESKIAAIRAKNQSPPIRMWEFLDLNQPAEKAA